MEKMDRIAKAEGHAAPPKPSRHGVNDEGMNDDAAPPPLLPKKRHAAAEPAEKRSSATVVALILFSIPVN